jgi:hypothetical protein
MNQEQVYHQARIKQDIYNSKQSEREKRDDAKFGLIDVEAIISQLIWKSKFGKSLN